MKLLGRKKGNVDDDTAAVVGGPVQVAAESVGSTRTTAPKGRPTPKRGQAKSGRRGPVAPAPMTAAEARARRKAMARPKLGRDERRAENVARRARATERRERMMAGEEAYLLPRDQGPIRRFARDVVDARRNLLGLFMPSTLGLMFIMLGVPQLQLFISPAMLLLTGLMAIDAVLLGRKVGKLVDDEFPGNTESHWRLGLYAAGRASQLRRMRAPRPQVSRGGRRS